MSKIYSALAGLCLSVLALGAQSVHAQTAPKQYVRCGTEEANNLAQQELKRLNPNYNPARSTNSYAPTHRSIAVSYTLPVIVHVINNGEAVGTLSNISQAQVQSQLDVLNEDYRKLNADGALTPAAFQPVRGDAQLQFVAARIDPSGNLLAEPGIDRVNRNTKNWTAPPYTQAYIQSTIKPGTSWDPARYVNIWVMNLGGGLLGYAQFPDNSAGLGGLSTSGGASNTDGVVILYSAYGSRAKVPGGTYISAYDKGRTLTHELGHWLGLRHIWGDATCGNDYCADTPTQQTSNFGCVTYPHVTCSNAGDQSMNYMDYSDDACLYMFSINQVDRMQAIMAANTPRRSTLATSNVACPNGVVSAGATNSGAACIGGSVTLTATGPAGATYVWTGPNGYTSTQQNPTLSNVTLATSGTYTVVVSQTTGTCPGSASTTVVVNSAAPTPVLATTATSVCSGTTATLSATNLAAGALINENFNGAATGWTISNTGGSNTGFEYRNAPYTYNSSSLPLNNYSLDGTRFVLANSDIGGGITSTSNTTLTSPAFSTVGYNALQLSFQQYLNYLTGDVATVEASINGTTWTAVATYTSSQGSIATPATTTVNLNAYVNQANLRLRWRYVTGWSYAWAIDNANVTGTATPVTYAWSVVSGNGLPAVTNTPTIVVSPTQSSVYQLTINYTGSPCTASSTIAVGLSANPPTPVLVATPAVICSGGTTTLSATNLAGQSNLTYTWTLVSGNGLPTATTGSTITVSPTTPSVYRLTLSYGGSATCTSTSTIAINALPTPTLAASSTTVVLGSPVTLSATNLTGIANLTYTWTLVSGSALSSTTVTNGATLTVSPTQASVYRLTVGSAGGGCTTSATISVGVSVDKWAASAYPVPFRSDGLTVRVETNTVGAIHVTMYDVMGRTVYDQNVADAQVGRNDVLLPNSGTLQTGKYIMMVEQSGQKARMNVLRGAY